MKNADSIFIIGEWRFSISNLLGDTAYTVTTEDATFKGSFENMTDFNKRFTTSCKDELWYSWNVSPILKSSAALPLEI